MERDHRRFVPIRNDETPAHAGASVTWSQGTRTPDLLGAIQALASPEFGLFAGFS
jgi:hypothetical protein